MKSQRGVLTGATRDDEDLPQGVRRAVEQHDRGDAGRRRRGHGHDRPRAEPSGAAGLDAVGTQRQQLQKPRIPGAGSWSWKLRLTKLIRAPNNREVACTSWRWPPPVPSWLLQSRAYVPERVYDTQQQALRRLRVDAGRRRDGRCRSSSASMHDDPNTHRLEAAILDGLQRRNGRRSCRSRCSSATCSGRSTPTSRGGSAKRRCSRARVRGRATRRDYRPLVETRQGAGLAGHRRQRAAPDRAAVAEAGKAAIDAADRSRARLRRARSAVPARPAISIASPKSMGSHPAPNQYAGTAARHGGTLLLVAVRQGRDHGRGDRRRGRAPHVRRRGRPLQRRLPQRLRSRHRRARPPPPPRQAHRRDLDAAGCRPRRAGAGRRGSEARRLPGLHRSSKTLPAEKKSDVSSAP